MSDDTYTALEYSKIQQILYHAVYHGIYSLPVFIYL